MYKGHNAQEAKDQKLSEINVQEEGERESERKRERIGKDTIWCT